MIAAPLKRPVIPDAHRGYGRFRDHVIAAPLKQTAVGGGVHCEAGFRDHVIAAPLKLVHPARHIVSWMLIPRSRDRGPIEANSSAFSRWRLARFRDHVIAAPLKRGVCDTSGIAATRFRDHVIAAPLKLGIGLDRR